MGAYVDVSEASFEQEVLQSDLPVLVDFWAPWCGPCRMLAPTVEKVAEKFQGKVKVAKVNVDDSPRVAMQFGIQGIPALLVFNGGELVNRGSGNMPQSRLEGLLEPVL